jgi:hypothetical protein
MKQILCGRGRSGSAHDRVVYDVADIPMVDGPADGRTATVELDEDRMPPRLELDDTVYVLEALAGNAPVAVPVAGRFLSHASA